MWFAGVFPYNWGSRVIILKKIFVLNTGMTEYLEPLSQSNENRHVLFHIKYKDASSIS